MPRRRNALMIRQATALFDEPAEREAFLFALTEGESREQAMIVLRDRPEIGAFPKERPLAWQPSFVVRLPERFRASKHPLYAKGAYYTLDFSSIFSASAMLAMETPPRRIFDVCASPGGKSVFAWRAFNPEILVANEVMKKRMRTLTDNFERCQIERSVVGSADPFVWAKETPNAFDLVLVDAPCSGQSLMAKGDEVPGCFSAEMVDMNHSRQRRILGNASRCVAPGGYLLYMTCTFTRKENEKVMEWLVREAPEFSAVEVPHLSDYRSRHSELPAYRLFPQTGLGAGAFACLLRREPSDRLERPPLDAFPRSWSYEDTQI